MSRSISNLNNFLYDTAITPPEEHQLNRFFCKQSSLNTVYHTPPSLGINVADWAIISQK